MVEQVEASLPRAGSLPERLLESLREDVARENLADTVRQPAGGWVVERGEEGWWEKVASVRRECERAGPHTGRLLESLVWQMSLLMMECSVHLPASITAEMEGLAREVTVIWTNWRTLSAEAAWAAREAAWQVQAGQPGEGRPAAGRPAAGRPGEGL